MTPPANATYLGDGVYASFDGFHLWLWTQRGSQWMQIALTDTTYAALQRYVACAPAAREPKRINKSPEPTDD